MSIGLNNLITSHNYLSKEKINFFKNKEKYKSNTFFYIIVPALREQKVITKTLNRLLDLNYPKNKYEIIVALDYKEKENNNKTTKEIVKEFNKKNKHLNIKIIEYKGQKQKRSLQLNTALKYINSKKNPENTFIGVYDADSYPDLNILKYINYTYNKDKTKNAFQQNLNYLLNFNKIRNNIILSGNAIYQTSWNYLFELNQFIKTNKRLKKGKKSKFPPYCMGHGEFFKLDILNNIKGFSEIGPTDGIQIGFTLTKNNIPIYPTPFQDYCESPYNLKTLYNQHAYWFLGNLTFFNIVKKRKINSIEFIQNLNHLMLSFKWLIRPFFVSFILIIFLIENRILFFILLILIWSYYIFSYKYISKIVYEKNLNIKKLKYKGFEIPFAVFYKSFGAIKGTIKIFKKIFKKEDVEFINKVER